MLTVKEFLAQYTFPRDELHKTKLARSKRRNAYAIEQGYGEGARALAALGVTSVSPTGMLAFYLCGGEDGRRVRTGSHAVATLRDETGLTLAETARAIAEIERKSAFFPLFGYVVMFDADKDRLHVVSRATVVAGAVEPAKARKARKAKAQGEATVAAQGDTEAA